MCDYFAFRTKAIATFPDLIVSVMMFDKGSGKDVSLTMYRVKVAGMAIGADLSSQGASAEEVLTELVRQVGKARRAKKEADRARQLARYAACNGGQTVQLLVRTGGSLAPAEQNEQPLKIAA
jgi:hypothetical protein